MLKGTAVSFCISVALALFVFDTGTDLSEPSGYQIAQRQTAQPCPKGYYCSYHNQACMPRS
jgi:hypothetical protein